MRNILKTLVLLALIAPLLFCRAYAENELPLDSAGLTEGLTEGEREIMGGMDEPQSALRRLGESLKGELLNSLSEDARICAELIFIALICALVSSLGLEGAYKHYAGLAACCAAALLTVGGVESFIGNALNTLSRISDYAVAALPVVYTAAAASGAPASAGAKYAVCCLALDMMLKISQDLIIPCIRAYLALCISCAVFENPILRSVAGLIKWLTGILMTLMVMIFTAYLSITGIIAGSTDALAVKTAKTVISTALPVVGGMISDAASVVLSSAAILKNSAGVFGLVAVIVICAKPFLKSLIRLLMLRMTATASELAGDSRLPKLISDIAVSMSLLTAMTGTAAIMLFIAFTAAMKAVT